MHLGGLLRFAARLPAYRSLLASLPGPGETLRLPVVEAAKPWLMGALQRDAARPMLVVTAHAKRASQVAEQLAAWLGDEAAVAHLPEPDALFYEAIPSDTSTRQARLRTLLRLADLPLARPPITVTSVRALLQRVVDPAALRSALTVLQRGARVNPNSLLARWVELGYRRELLVEEPGTFARRGGIVDIYTPTAERPVRLDFFDEELESIRLFDPITQRSDAQVQSFTVGPAVEVWPAARRAGLDELRQLDLSGLRGDVRERWEQEIARLEVGESDGNETLAPFFAAATLLDYLPREALLVLDEAAQLRVAADELLAQAAALREELVSRAELPQSFPVPYTPLDELLAAAAPLWGRLELTWQSDAERHDEGSLRLDDGAERPLAEHWQVTAPYGGRLKVVLDDCARAVQTGTTVVVISQQSSRLSELCRERDLFASPVSDVPALPPAGSLTIVHGALPEGFGVKLAADAPPTLLVLSDQELFGWSKPSRVVRRRAVAREAFVAELTPGDFVVHVEHGVAGFLGLVTMSADGVQRDYLSLEYADGDRLYVPTDHADRVSRYVGIGEHAPSLSRLGGLEWARSKARVRAAAKEVAKELLDIYAAREAKPGYAFSPDVVWQQELEASFPYVETPDQLQAVAEVKADMEKPKPMDRLLCGDVGYGKTEIALRAAFKAVTDGKQVALLVPTTVLAQQHHNTFRERMQAFPLRLEMLSRFRSDKEQRAVLAALRAGAVDICIGTHRLIQKDVAFKDLGLVIIDEEQRFGVLHKEHLKRLRKEVDVLTLTATPIPRTLYMALAGVRDISTMETPPEERLPIKTYVTEYAEGLIREAMLRELERGGQIYFVHNRVQTIHRMAEQLQSLVPEARIAVGHGQLPEEQLEQVMLDFSAGKYDVLVCSTIIESGLDIPNVNTIIVNQADRLGLAQMYQLRGRVGRGANRAFAYFMFDKDRRLTPTAERRLRTIFEATELGAGFRIAMKDLEIRGAGNLLGSEQHGHVAAVGFDLYCRLLAEAVQELQGKVEARPAAVRLDLPLSAYLPAEYVSDDALRLNLYQRLAAVNSGEQLSALVLEMKDRFGALPRPAVNLAYLIQVKLLAGKAGVIEVGSDGPALVLRLARPERLDRAAVQRAFGQRLNMGHSLLRLERGRGEQWMDALQQLLGTVAHGVAAAAAATDVSSSR